MKTKIKRVDVDKIVLKLMASTKEYLYCESPLRNKFQVRPIDIGEVKVFENVKYARVSSDEDYLESVEFRDKDVLVPFYELGGTYEDRDFDVNDSFDSFMQLVCTDMLARETAVYQSLKKYLTQTRKGITLVRTDLQIVPAIDTNGTFGVLAFEQLGTIVLKK